MYLAILSFTLCFFSVSLQAHAAVEVYAAGKYFNSFEDYKNNKPGASSDFSKPLISKQNRQELNKMSYNQGVSHMVVDFQQNWQNPQPRFIVNSEQLQEAIRQTLGDRPQAAMIISDPQKMRILSLVSEQNKTFPVTTEDGQTQ